VWPACETFMSVCNAMLDVKVGRYRSLLVGARLVVVEVGAVRCCK